MKINEVVKKTGLTKKAIRYYEQEGIIKPLIDGENNYRDYSDEDVKRLLETALFRQLDMSIKDIKTALEKPENLNRLLEEHKARIEEDIRQMERNKNILNTILKSSELSNPIEVTDKLKLLSDSINLNNMQRANYIKEELLRLFPGAYGKLVVLSMTPFLNFKIDNREKEKAWLEIIRFLDDFDFDYPEEFEEMFKNLPENFLEGNQERIINEMNNIANMSEEDKKAYKQKVLSMAEKAVHDETLVNAYQKNFHAGKALKEILTQKGFYDVFINNLLILSDEYRKYHNLLAEIYDELKTNYIGF